MTHDDILKAARERLVEIDKQTAALAEERGKLQAMLGAPVTLPVLPVAPWPYPPPPWDRVWPLPEVTWYPRIGEPGTFTIATTGTDLVTWLATPTTWTDRALSGALVVGGEQRLDPSLHFTS